MLAAFLYWTDALRLPQSAGPSLHSATRNSSELRGENMGNAILARDKSSVAATLLGQNPNPSPDTCC